MVDVRCRRSGVSESLSLTLLSPPGEVRPPERVQQTDLAATLAVGLGLPIPQHSVGRFLFPVVEGRAMREQLRLLHLNAVQLSRLLRARIPGYERGESRPPSIGPGLPRGLALAAAAWLCFWSSAITVSSTRGPLSQLRAPSIVVTLPAQFLFGQQGWGCPHGAQLERQRPLVSGVRVARAWEGACDRL